MHARRRPFGLAALWLSLVVLSGCGSSTDRRPLHGRVEVDGVAVARGSISLLPAAGNSGPAANGVIADGEYRFTTESGPYGGPHRVLIDVESLSGEERAPGQDGPGDVQKVDVKRMGVRAQGGGPSRAGADATAKRHWELDFTVPEDGEARKDFHLEE